MACQTNRLVADGTAAGGPRELHWITIIAQGAGTTTVTLKDGGAGAAAKWDATIQQGTTQHFVFEDAMKFSTSIYVDADTWGVATLGFT